MRGAALILALLIPVSLSAQSTSAAQPGQAPWSTPALTLTLADAPQPVTSAAISMIGNPGARTASYWIVTNTIIGSSTPAGPFVLSSAPNAYRYVQLDSCEPSLRHPCPTFILRTGSQEVATSGALVSWAPVSNAVSYDLLRTWDGSTPTGACNCAVATGITVTSYPDALETLNAYTVAPIDPNAYAIRLTNQSTGPGASQLEANGQPLVSNSGSTSGSVTLTQFDVRNYGAKVDGKAAGDGWAAGSNVVSDCATTSGSTALTCASAHFTRSDVGKTLLVYGAGAAGLSLGTTIAGYVSATQITMAAAAGVTTSTSPVTITGATMSADSYPYPTTLTCSTPCNVVAGQWVTLQNANNHIYNNLVQVYGVTDSTHFTIVPLSGADPSSPLTSATMLTTSPRVVWGTDDSAADQAAIDAAATAGGGSVYFPAGISLASNLQLSCSGTGFTDSYTTCTKSYNNIEIAGEGRRISVIENSNVTGTTPVMKVGAVAQPAWEYGSNNDWLRGFKLHDLSLLNPLTFSTSNLIEPFIMSNTYNAEIYNAQVTSNMTEGFYLMNNYGDKVHDNTAGPCGLSCYNMTNENEEAYNNTAVVPGQGFEIGSTNSKYHDNFIDFRGRGGTFSCMNVGSTNRGIWGLIVEKNYCWGQGITISNVNGVACDNVVQNNIVIDGSIGVGSGLDLNDNSGRANLQPCPTGHGTSVVKGNTTISDLRAGGMGGNFPESIVLEDNTNVWRTARCQGPGLPTRCNVNADCNVAAGQGCSFMGGAFGVGPQWLGGTKQYQQWAPATSYTGQTSAAQGPIPYVVPSIPNAYMYANLGATGTSGSTEPSWCTPIDCTVTDGGITWTNRGPAATAQLTNNHIDIEAVHPNPMYDYGTFFSYTGIGRSYIAVNGLDVNVPWATMNPGLVPNGDAFNEPGYEPWLSPGFIPASARYDESNRWWTGPTAPTTGYWKAGTTVHRTDPAPALTGWAVTNPGWAAPSWTASTGFSFSNLVQPSTANGYAYEATGACTTGASEPGWPSTGTVTDGTCTWKAIGTAAVFSTQSAGYLLPTYTVTPTITACEAYASNANAGCSVAVDGTITQWARGAAIAGNVGENTTARTESCTWPVTFGAVYAASVSTIQASATTAFNGSFKAVGSPTVSGQSVILANDHGSGEDGTLMTPVCTGIGK